MTDLCIQIHPHRTPDLDLAAVRTACEAIATDNDLISHHSFVDGTDGHYYANLMFATDQPAELWDLLERTLYQSPNFGSALQRSSMAMCEGKHGWADYLLLCHFDPNVQCERFSDR